MKNKNKKKLQEKVFQDLSKIEETIEKILKVETELEAKVRSFRAGGRSDQQIANLLMVSQDIIKEIK